MIKNSIIYKNNKMKLLKLKFSIILVGTSLVFTSCNENKKETDELNTDLVKNSTSATSVNKDEIPVIEFEKETHDFGKIKEGEKVSYSFKFKNTGNSDLIITDAKGSCGCTVPNYPTKPIKPGEEGLIDVSFDSAGKSGKQNKTVTLLTNSEPSTKILTIIGEVNPLKAK